MSYARPTVYLADASQQMTGRTEFASLCECYGVALLVAREQRAPAGPNALRKQLMAAREATAKQLGLMSRKSDHRSELRGRGGRSRQLGVTIEKQSD